MPINCVGIFCEDIREETGGTHTIIGVMPDNINLQGQEGLKLPDGDSGKLLFPKMGFYLRANLDVSAPAPKQIAATVSFPGHGIISLGMLGTEAIEKAFADSHSNKVPSVGVVFKAVITPLPITESGLATLHVNVDGQEQMCGTLNIRIIHQPDATASPQPS
jgi:hypothetical protein